MSLSRNVDPADHAMSVVDQDPPSIPVGVHPPRAPLEDKGSQQLVQWLSVQADHMAGSLQQNARALMVRASSPMPSSAGIDTRMKLHDFEPNFNIQRKSMEICVPYSRIKH